MCVHASGRNGVSYLSGAGNPRPMQGPGAPELQLRTRDLMGLKGNL